MCYSVFPVDPYSILKYIHSTELFLKYLLRAVMFCVMSVDLGAVTFLHWLRMAAVLLSVGLCLTKGCCFPGLFSFHTPASLAQSSCWGIRMKLWECLFYSLSIWSEHWFCPSLLPIRPPCLTSWTHDMVSNWFMHAFLMTADAKFETQPTISH